MPEPLTGQQQRVLDALTAYIRVHGYPPTMRELGDTVHLHTSGVWYQLDQLVAKGWITRVPGKPRALRVVHLQEVNTDAQ